MRWSVCALALSVSCTAITAPTASPSSSLASSVAQTTPRTTPTPTSTLLFQVGADQARFVATVVAFFDAMNAGVEAAALSLVTENVVGGDCDPTKELPAVGGPATRSFGNKAAFAGWLRERVRDQERWEIGQIVNENPEPTTGSRVVAVGFTRRTSDPLRASGRPDGVHPGGAAKIVFTTDGRQIIALALPCT